METHHSKASWLTRRAFLGTAAGVAASVSGLPLLLPERSAVPAACAATDFTLRAPEPNPKYGGVLRYGMTSTPPHFDIHQSGTVNNMGTQGCMYDNLIRRNPLDSGQTIIPDLAHGWEIAPDGKTYTFFLRQGVKFHDGAALTAEDVQAGRFDLASSPVISTLMDPSDYFHSWYGKDGPQNYSQWSNKEFQELVDQIDRELDEAKRKTLVSQAEAIMEQDPPVLPVAWEKINDAWYNYVKGHNPYNYFGMFDVVRFDTFWLDT